MSEQIKGGDARKRPMLQRGRFCFAVIVAVLGSLSSSFAADRAVIWSRMWERMNEQFVGFDRAPETNWRREYQEGLTALQSASSDVEFWRELRRRIAGLENGRTAIKFPTNLPREYDAVPLRAMVAGERVFVKRLSAQAQLQQSGIKVGDEIVAVEGMPVFAYLDSVAVPHTSGSAPAARRAAAVYRVFTGRADSGCRLTLRRTSSEEFTVNLLRDSGLNGQYVSELDEPMGEAVRELGDGIVYVNCYAHLVPNTDHVIVAQIESRSNLQALVLDLRESQTGVLLENALSHLIESAVTVESGLMISDSLTKSRADLGAVDFVRYLSQTPGRILQPTKPQFSGKLVVLTSLLTAGPAEEFIHALANRAIVVGDTTAGAAYQVAVIDLGEGAAMTYAVTKPDWGNGLGDGVGIAPSVRALPTAAGLSTGRDEVLARALEVIASTK